MSRWVLWGLMACLVVWTVACDEDSVMPIGDAVDVGAATDAANGSDGAVGNDGSLPDGTVPDAQMPDGTVPDAQMPDGTVPGNSMDGGMAPSPDAPVERVDVTVSYETQRPDGLGDERREMTVRVYYPLASQGPARLILVSHGGQGSMRGHASLGHLGEHYAARGYVAAHIGHRPSPGVSHHRWDRPHDVSAVIDHFADNGTAALAGFSGELVTNAVAHIGHSWGAYTAHGVAGGQFRQTAESDALWTFRDDRVVAMAALSPQGPGGFGAYDQVCEDGIGACPEDGASQPSADNTWQSISIPTFHLVGEAELDGVVGIEQGAEDAFRARFWRLYPYFRMPADGRRYLSVLPDGTHGDLGNTGSPAVKRYLALNTRLFFDAYLRDDARVLEEIGRAEWVEGVDHRRK